MVSQDGKRATLVLDAEILSYEGGQAQIVREAVQMTRWGGNWVLPRTALDALMIRD